MKITVDKVLRSAASLAEFTRIKLPMNTSLILAENQRELNHVCEVYETKRVALVEKWGVTSEDTGEITVKAEDAAIFLKERSEMLKEEVEVALMPIDIKALPDDKIEINGYVLTEDLVIEGSVLVDLDWLLVKPEKVLEKKVK